MNKILVIVLLVLVLFICRIIYVRNYKPMFLSNELKDNFYELFKKFDFICKENNIHYFIIAGTLLGAVRHQEMIHWDDDIDVGILDEDLEKLQNIDFIRYGLQQKQVTRNSIGKIFFENQHGSGNKYESVFIDIFVFEKVENRYQYTSEFALDTWKREFFYENELFPLQPYTFKNMIVMGPNDSLSYSNRAWGKNWMDLPLSSLIKFIYYPEKLVDQPNKYDKYVNYNEISKKIHFFILNMDKDTDRYQNTKSQLDSVIYKPNYSRIKGIDGRKMDNDIVCIELLQPKKELVGKEFNHSDQKWIYDGTPSTSFPSLNINDHYGTKGLTLTNMIAFQEALKPYYNSIEWFCILEDDAVITDDSFRAICNFIINPKNSHNDIVVLDVRKYGGTTGVLYNRKILNKLLNDLHPLSDFSIRFYEKMNRSALWDWKLYDYIRKEKSEKIFHSLLPCIKESGADSTINI